MMKVAFFVDGNFLFHQVKYFKSFFCNGPNIRKYCERHLNPNEKLYRIFYYDAPPLERTATTPCGTPIDFGKSSAAQHMKKRLDSIRETPYMALRLGKVTWQNDWILSNDVITDLMNGKRDITSLCDHDFQPNIQQKIVDMKIGLDISTITYKKFASRIVLIAGDSDFVPAAKLARMEGIHVTIDPMGKRLTPDLIEHVDFVHTELDPDNSQDVDPSRKNFFVKNFKED